MEQVHRPDGQGDVCGVLALAFGYLEDRLDAVVAGRVDPAGEPVFRKVAEDAFDDRIANRAKLSVEFRHQAGGKIFAVDQQCDIQFGASSVSSTKDSGRETNHGFKKIGAF